MTPFQKRLFLFLSVAIALTRFLAVARTLFDWDEALFCLGIQEFDVAEYRPHPPGYPLFVAAAKVVHLLGVPEFRSLQVVVVLGALALFPALFLLAREIGFDFTTSACGAAIFAFLPNVWTYGGTGFSDVPATALGFAACALLLRGRRDSRAYILGAVVLGAAAGFRPLTLLAGAVPALLATWERIKARAFGAVATAILLGGAVVAGSYFGAALASSSVLEFVEAVQKQSKWVREVDSWHNPRRGPLVNVAKTFFLFPVQQKTYMTGLALLAMVSCLAASVQRRFGVLLLTLAMFGPIALLSWLDLDINTAARYAVSFMAVHALLAADGLRVIGRQPRVQAALAAAVVLVFALWTLPALRTQRTTDAPPVAALEWIRRNVETSSTVYVSMAFHPHAELMLPKHSVVFFESTAEIPLMAGKAWVVDWRLVPDGMNFVRPHDVLWKIIRRRNFETSVSRVASIIGYGEGWYAPEGDEPKTFRWMAKDSHAMLPPFPGRGRISIRAHVPVDAIQPPPAIEIYVNGTLRDRFLASRADLERAWVVESRADAPNDLRIVTSATMSPSRGGRSLDTRELGLRVDALRWTPLP
jgi:hypothetical protein